MSDANIFGAIVSPKQIERGMAAAISYWINDYLCEMERIDGYTSGSIERPRGVITVSEFAKWPEDQIPVILVMNNGLASKPERRGDGIYDTSWLIGVAAVVSAMDFATTRDLAGTYAGAIRSAVLQHKMLASPSFPDGVADHTIWHDESYRDLPFNESRTLGSAHVIFEVGVTGVTTEYAGPRTPIGSCQDPGPWPQVQEAVVNVVPIGVGESL